MELDAPNIGELEKQYVNRTMESGFVSTFGPFVSEFEEKFADYLGVKKAVSLQSGTAALHMALYELGIGPGDEVIVPVLTFVATANSIVYVGATPVFVDVDVKTWNMDPAGIEKAITKKTKAILPVHLFGNACNIDEIMSIAQRYRLYVIEDATESLGTKYRGRYTGTFSDCGCYSFNGNKTITTGGGGMVVGNNESRLNHIKFLVNQARQDSGGYYHSEIGFNYRMTNMEAALGISQLQRLGEFTDKKRRFRKIYEAELKNCNGISFQENHKEADVCWWLTCIIFKRGTIAGLQNKLKAEGVPTRRIFMPIVEFPPYKRYNRQDYKNAYFIYERGLCLPSSTLNCEKDICYVCEAVKKVV